MHVLPFRYVLKLKNSESPHPLQRVSTGSLVDYSENYATVVTLAAVRVFFSIIEKFELEFDKMDVIIAFLNGDLEEDIYMQVTAGFKDPMRPNLL